MTSIEEQALYEREAENNLRYIWAKLPYATAAQLAYISAFISGLRIVGFSKDEYNRSR